MGNTSTKYRRLGAYSHDYDAESSTGPLVRRHRWLRCNPGLPCLRLLFAICVMAASGAIVLLGGRSLGLSVIETSVGERRRRCERPALRREWRTLDAPEKTSYITAVQCLMHHPSIFQGGTSFYDDFIFAHSKTGVYSHYAAAFLPWHRMYVHVFEQALRQKCDYGGTFPYWDWTLDSDDLSASPIWDAEHGFGGDGNAASPVTAHGGRCVMDGPFANTTRAWDALSEGHAHDVALAPHCLSRGFTTDPETLAVLQRLASPRYVQETLGQPDYAAFFKKFEQGAHNAVPQFIKGDFLTFSAPNDPVFFLHHAQVDRLWWTWQQRDPKARLAEFHGPAEDFRFHEHAAASSKADVLPMAGLAEDRTVEDVMDAAGGYLCYEY